MQRRVPSLDVEISLPAASWAWSVADAASGAEAVSVLVRCFGVPVGTGVLTATDAADRTAVGHAVAQWSERAVRHVAARAGVPAAPLLAGAGATAEPTQQFRHRHDEAHRTGPWITVVVCTRERPADLERALRSLTQQSYTRFQVLVVDNAPTGDATRRVVEAAGSRGEPVSYVCEPQPGLSRARNSALAVVGTDVVAWLDDDEVADPEWLVTVADAFQRRPGLAGLSGSVVPAELETQAQVWFEEYGGHTKGRGFVPDLFDGSGPMPQSPLYPLPSFGVGANMAFDVAALQDIGGFDRALGAGTLTLGGEDTLAFTRVLLGGGVVAYEPAALTRHYHRRDYDSLVRQMTGYGVGLTAYYTSLLRHDPRLVGPLLRLAPTAVRDVFSADGKRLADLPEDFPSELLRRKTRGMLVGPFAYARSRRRTRPLDRKPAR